MRRAAQGKSFLKQRPDTLLGVEKLLIGKTVLVKNVAEHDVTVLGHDVTSRT